MPGRKKSQSKKKKGEQSNEVTKDGGSPIATCDHVAVASPTRRSSTPTADQHPSEPQLGGFEETDGRETKSKRDKKKKGDNKETDKDHKSKKASFRLPWKKTGQNVSSPVMSETPERRPSSDHTPLESEPGKLQGDDSVVFTASVDSTLVNHESQIDQLKIQIEALTAKQNDKDKEIALLRREKAQMVTEVREALHKHMSQDSKEGQTHMQTHKLHTENELETASEEIDRLAEYHKENISEIESVREELSHKDSEVKQITEVIETTKEEQDREIENIKTKHGEEIDHLRDERLKDQHKMETEIADWKSQVQEAEEKAAEFKANLGKLDKEKENMKEKMEILQAEHAQECSNLQEVKVQHETEKEAEIKDWKTRYHKAEQEVAELAKKMDKLEKVREEHETELKNIRAEHAQEYSSVREAKLQEESDKEAEIQLLKTRNHEAEQEIAELATKLETLQKMKEEHEFELNNITAEHAQECSRLREATENEVEQLQERLEKLEKDKDAELAKKVENLVKVKEEHEIELQNIKAKHTVENSNLSKEKQTEVEQWKKKSEEAENKVKQLQERLDMLDKERDDKICALPTGHHMEHIEKAHAQHASEIAELTSNLESKNKELVRQIEERNEELRHQLDEAKRVHSEQLQQVQVNFEEKHNKNGQSVEQQVDQQVEKRMNQLEKASRDRFRELKIDNERLKAEADKLRKEAEEYLEVKEDLEKKRETINELEVQLKILKTLNEQIEHKQKMATASMKGVYDQKRKGYETQLQKKAAEIETLTDQLDKFKQQVLAFEHEKNEQSEVLKKLREENNEYENRITEQTLEMASIRREFDKQSTSYDELQERHRQLEVELEIKKHVSDVTCSNSEEEASDLGKNPIEDVLPQQHVCGPHSDEEEEYHSLKSQNSLHQDNLTDTEKAELQRKLREVLDQISDRDLKIKELEDQLSVCRKSLLTALDEELHECAKGSSDAKKKMFPHSKVAALKQMYVEAAEKLVKANKKHEIERKSLIEKLEDRQKQLEGERQMPQTHPPYSSEHPLSVKEMDHETAKQEVLRLRYVVSEKEAQVSSLQMQVKSFESTCTQYSAKEKHSKDPSHTVKDSLQGSEPGQVKQKGDSTSEAELAKAKQKICDLEEEIGIYKREVDGEKQNVQQEVEKSRHLEHKINQLHREKVHLEEQLAGYDKMNEEVGIFKASAANMLKRFRTFLGKGEAEHPPSENVDLECANITKRLSKLMEELELRKFQAELYKKDFEEERKEREEAAKNKDEEIAEMQNQFSKTVTEKHNELQSQLEKAHIDIENVRAELENSKKLLEDALTNAEQDTEKHKQELSDMEQVLQHNQKKIQDEKARLDGKVHSLEDERAQIALERDQLRENRDKLKEERDDLQKQVQDMCDENDRINCELKAKVKEAEIHAAERNHIENEYHHLQEQQREANCVRDALQSELTEVKEQIERACADKVTLEGESLAKTQQVKQYKKQVDHYKAQLQESNTRIEEYIVQLEQCKHELAYCQADLNKREEYEQNTADYMSAQYESELSTLKLEVGALKREKADMEVKLRQHQIGAVAPHTASYVDQNEKEKAELHQKYIKLMDRYDVMFQYNDQLVAILVQNNITVPNAKTPLPQAQQHVSTSPYQERVTHDGRQYNRQSDPNRSITTPAGVGAPQDHQLNYGQYQQGVRGVASSPPSMQRAGEGAAVVVSVRDHQVHSHEVYHENNPLPVVYNQGQPSMYQSEQGVGHPSGGGGGVPVNYPQGYGQPQPPNAATYGSTYPESQNYSGMEVRPSEYVGAGQQGLMTPEPETGRRVASGPHENALIKGINTEIHSVAAGVGRQVDRNPEMDSLSPQAPFDPNLICPMCRLQYRIGEIQKYRKHVKYCQGT